jgi:DNA mismatch repair ATPase MutS
MPRANTHRLATRIASTATSLRSLRRMEKQFRRMFDIDSWAASPKLSAYNRQLRRARSKEQRPTYRNMVRTL